MFSIIKTAAFALLLGLGSLVSANADAAIIQLNGSGQYQSEVISDNGWTNNYGAGEVDFWILTLTEESKLSVAVLADIVFGFSLYSGELLLDPGMLFSNYADFFGFAGESLTFLTGTDPFTPLSDGTLIDFILPAGSYTLAVGGNDFGFDPFGSYQYTLDLKNQPTKLVSAPATATLLLLAFAMLLRQQRRR
ncbi:hypothetical protein A5320_10630 [Rheinheimera sp. SA_1]|uniref:hypothetical protein n=1 Tax=Rheinheimera sp. SA_1 TaxID=1827365 RepID=UPI0007FFC4AF|nr:hypothetical protein [Rheinheimera sp. SA_1]OBP15737.1 hypothetical protein A5320_10630 [Rheinheimera sp. SA_1]